MNRNHVGSLVLVFVLLGVFGLAVRVQMVEASGTIYIRANGLVEGTDKIATADNITYTFTDNINDSIVIERSNIIIDGDRHTLQGVTHTGKGFSLNNIDNVTIKSTNIKGFYAGLFLNGTSHISIFDNNITDNFNGVDVYHFAVKNTISGNNITDCYNGIILTWEPVNHNTISGNIVTNNSIGIEIGTSTNNVVGNKVANNWIGIELAKGSNSNIVSGNLITDNKFLGLRLQESSDNRIYHNNLINNTQHAWTDSLRNVWDDGYPSGGNYWSNYNGTDSYSGPYQNETGFDWIGDSPYVIDQNNTDRYPLMTHFSSDIEETRIAYRNLLLRFTETSTEIEALNSTLAGLVDRITGMQSQLDSLNETVLYLQQQIVALNTTVASTRSELQAQIESLNSQVLGLQGRLDSLNSTLQSSTNTQQDHYNSLSNQMKSVLNMTYTLAATSVILVIAVVYIIVRKPRTKPEA